MKVFLSHSSKDRAFVNRLAIDLESRGFEVWYDQWELDVGDSLLEKIQDAIKQSYWLVIILSPYSVSSRWVREELNAFLSLVLAASKVSALPHNLPYILPVLIQECEIPIFLHDKVYADFRYDYNSGLQRLVATLKRQYSKIKEEIKPRLDETVAAADALLERYRPTTLYFVQIQSNEVDYASKACRNLDEEIINLLSGLWVGPTGRMQLLVDHNQIRGTYDWQGYELSGRIEGKLIPRAIVFDWVWSISEETGSGLFYWPVPDTLVGGWWMSYDCIDAHKLLSSYAMPPNKWVFTRNG